MGWHRAVDGHFGRRGRASQMVWVLGWGLAIAIVAGCGGDDGPEPAPEVDASMPEPDPTPTPEPEAPVDQGVDPPDEGPLDAEAAEPDAAPAEPDAEVDAAPIDCGECPGGLICDPATGDCAEPPVCAGDADCLDGRHCAPDPVGEARCVDDCVEDAACPGTRRCDLDSGRCPEPEVCLAPEDCDAGRVCFEMACVDACQANDDCPGNQSCGPDGLCVEAEGCAADEDCLGGRICGFGACTDRCLEDADCPGTRDCDVVSGRCPEPAVCFAEGDCDPGRVCDDGQCTAVCEGDDGCPGRQQCGPEGICVEPAACVADEDCRGARFCADGACTAPCRESADCPGALVCDLDTGRCGEPPQGCLIDADCIGDRVCVEGLCADPQCEAHADCAGEAGGERCVDRVCGDEPVACLDDGACPPDRGCAPVGVCAADAACGGDDDCAGLRPVCLVGRCVACRGDVDCAPSAFCDAGRCVFFDGCAEDLDCPGRRQCADGACVAEACFGDAFDDDDPRAAPLVSTRTYTGLVLCDGDIDRYRVELEPGEGLQATIRHDPAEGDLGVRITAAGAPDLVYVESDDGDGFDRAAVPPSPAGQSVDVEVFGRIGYSAGYTLSLDRLGEGACPPDGAEGPFDNDAPERATPLGVSPIDLRLCPDDTDWFAVELAPGTAFTALAAAEGAPEALVFDLFGPDGEALGSGQPGGRALQLDAEIEAGGRHLIELGGIGPGLDRVELRLSAESLPRPEASAAACAAATPLPDDGRVALPESLPVDRFDLSCAAGAGAPDHVARLELARAATIELAVRPDDRQTTIALRRRCDDPESETRCIFGVDSGPLELEAGTWFVIVESSGAVPQTVEVVQR